MKTLNLSLMSLGDALGSLRYLGSCACCRDQFMSTHIQVCCAGGRIFCTREKCLTAAATEARKEAIAIFNYTEQRIRDAGGITDPSSYEV
jgi:hypothetical protein